MFYLKVFNTAIDYNNFLDSSDLLLPNTSYIVETMESVFNPLLSPIKYYNSLDVAISDINSYNIGKNATNYETKDTVCRVILDDKLHITLLNDASSSKTLNTQHELDINLNNKVLRSANNTIITANNNVSITNGSIYCDMTNASSDTAFLLFNGETCHLTNVTFNTITNGGGTGTNPLTTIRAISGLLDINNCEFFANDSSNGSISSIYINENAKLNGDNIQMELTAPNGISTNIFSMGDITLNNSNIQGFANHTANAAGTDYASLSRSIFSMNGNVTLTNCTMYGTHSAITVRNGELYIDGGEYNGYSHGGVYLGNNNCNSYIKNASLNDVPMQGEGMYDDGVAGTNGAAMYIGGASYMNVYVNNCNFYGKIQPIVLKYSASSSHDNHLYISKSTMNTDYTRCGIRNDGANYVTFGALNTFDYTALENERNYDTTTEIYDMN